MAFLSFPEAKFQLPKFEDAQIAIFQGFGFNSAGLSLRGRGRGFPPATLIGR